MPTKQKLRPVVVTTEHRGVFFGFLDGQVDTEKTLAITDAQMCVYWPTSTKGILGLASTGPTKGAKVTPSVPRIVLQSVTSVMDATEEAVKAWQSRPWS
jgi:hypothetical protein